MSLPRTIETYMHKHHVHYNNIHHEPTITALANTAKIQCEASQMAKVVAFKLDGQHALFVLPSNEKIHIPTLKEELRVKNAKMLTENEMKWLFKDCELGAQPAIGSLYNMPTFLSSHLKNKYSIFFNGGTHTDCIQMETEEFIKLEKPGIFDFSVPYSEYEMFQEVYFYTHN